MVFITLRIRLTGTEDPSWTCESVSPWTHGFIETYNPGWAEQFLHVLPPCTNHLAHFPELVKKGWWLVVGETDVLIQPLHPAHEDVRVELVGAWVVALIKLHAIEKVSLREANMGSHEALETQPAQHLSQICLWLANFHEILRYARHKNFLKPIHGEELGDTLKEVDISGLSSSMECCSLLR
jgi:hypothetical protein